MAPCGAASRLIHFKRGNGGRVVMVVIPDRCGNPSGLASCASDAKATRLATAASAIQSGSERRGKAQHCTERYCTVRQRTATGRSLRFRKAHKFVDPLLWDGLQAPRTDLFEREARVGPPVPKARVDPYSFGPFKQTGPVAVRCQIRCSAMQDSVPCSMPCLARGYFSRCLPINSRVFAYLMKLLKHPTAM